MISLKRSFVLALSAIFVTLPTLPASAQSTPNAGGSWNVKYSGTPLTGQRLDLEQEGPAILGTFGSAGRIDGKENANNSQQYDLAWSGDSGRNGWGTMVFAPDYKTFHGQYGLPGKKPAGTFIATRIYPTFPPVSGLWNLSRSGGATFATSVVSLKQSGATVVGSFDAQKGSFSGTFPQGVHVVTGDWKHASGSGWLALEFAPDSKSVSGSWGMAGSTVPSGTLVGSVNTTPLPVTTGKWKVTLTGQAAHGMVLLFRQNGSSIVGTWQGGHISGTIPAGSDSVKGTWQTMKASGPLTLTFAANSKTFSGFWGYPGKPNKGRVLGERI
jgi:hypothetical protein